MNLQSLLGVVLILACAMMGCSSSPLPVEGISPTLFTSLNAGSPVLMTSVVDGRTWDQLVILKPYDQPGDVEKQLDVSLPSDVGDLRLEQRDDICVLVFLNQKRVTQWAEVKRSDADFTTVTDNPIAKASANFVQRRDDKGWKFVETVSPTNSTQ